MADRRKISEQTFTGAVFITVLLALGTLLYNAYVDRVKALETRFDSFVTQVQKNFDTLTDEIRRKRR